MAQRSLDGLLSGLTSVFPDTYARITEEFFLHKMPRILTDPNQALDDMVTEYLQHPQAGQ